MPSEPLTQRSQPSSRIIVNELSRPSRHNLTIFTGTPPNLSQRLNGLISRGKSNQWWGRLNRPRMGNPFKRRGIPAGSGAAVS